MIKVRRKKREKPKNFLSCISLIRNGEKFNYTYKELIRNTCPYVDDFVMNFGITPEDDGTKGKLLELSNEFPSLRIVDSEWDMENIKEGTELAIQINKYLHMLDTEWVIYLQADEMLRPEDGAELREFLKTVPSDINQVELLRTYFWGTLQNRAEKHEIWLGRVFRAGTHYVGGDGMWIVQKAPGGITRHPALIFHYSRMGSEEEVNARWRNLDTFYHTPEKVAQFHKFDYEGDLEGRLISYNGPHPNGIEEFFSC
jgi:hypothetical protein